MSGVSYFCCQGPENPWDNIFGCGGTQSVTSATYSVSNSQFKVAQDWNNPFSSSSISSHGSAGRPEARSISSYDQYVTTSSRNGDNEDRVDVQSAKKKVTFKEPHFENMSPSFSRKKGTVINTYFDQMCDSDSSDNNDSNDGDDNHKKIMMTGKMDKKLKKRGLVRSPIDGNKFVKKDSLSIKRKLQLLVMRTETTRPKKELTPEDVRDPETVPGMKLLVDIEKEKKAQERATTMISTDEFLHDEKAGAALYTLSSDRGQVRRINGKVNPIV
mmetsp:Transcript_8058/g.15178  ORF Transcript_8058/g.15178 Transcript_8058/m.15178 type:complete len:272 (+) Transcript_8058:154-969(+)|eukprot:CAMPEP_0176497644 /NCGR_PEP_ID=MMETSP0200_2-20121128/11841_1 /TAXON_ID=947934 /ORGANISM="Chaetoceros sp., Strain GSL56" /LENGTH=271 /DNA_ID=CAMNT_0017895685 /DNA_START=118 /DNA_END=933 /DNA_ORIENTATION=-